MSDRNNGKRGGGCVIYFSEDLNACEKEELNGKADIESVWIDITMDSQKLLLGTIYRPQDNILFYDNLHKLIEPLWIKRNNITLLGDFNSDLLFRDKSHDESYLGKKTCKCTEQLWFKKCHQESS